jgi:hypothetical protein
MENANERGSSSWTTDFVEHIRTVNFALLGVCLTLIGVLQLQRPIDIAAAQSQFQEVKSVVDNWDVSQQWPYLRDTLDRIGTSSTVHMPGDNKVLNGFRVGEQNFVIADAAAIRMVDGPSSDGGVVPIEGLKDTLFKRPLSLLQFREMWDRTVSVLSFRANSGVGDKYVVARKNGSLEAVQYTFAPLDPARGFGAGEISAVDTPTGKRMADLLKIPAPSFALSWDVGGDRILLPIGIHETPFDIQPAFIQTHPYWKPGQFSVAFKALNDATVSIQDKSFEAIALTLQEQASKPKSDEFEVFGVKWPVEKATRWGILLIVAIQLYLWVHLHELSPRLKFDDAGWDVAWVGVYRSLPSKILFVASTVLLPLLTIAALANNALREANSLVWGIYIGSFVASVILGILIVRAVPHRGARLDSRGMQRS